MKTSQKMRNGASSTFRPQHEAEKKSLRRRASAFTLIELLVNTACFTWDTTQSVKVGEMR